MKYLVVFLLAVLLPSFSLQEGQEAFSKEVKCLGKHNLQFDPDSNPFAPEITLTFYQMSTY